jgi:hypothetical protein
MSHFNRFQTEFDEDQEVPELLYEWLNPQELVQHQVQREQDRENIIARNQQAPATPEEPEPVPLGAPPQVALIVTTPPPTPTVIAPQIVVPAPAIAQPPPAQPTNTTTMLFTTWTSIGVGRDSLQVK